MVNISVAFSHISRKMRQLSARTNLDVMMVTPAHPGVLGIWDALHRAQTQKKCAALTKKAYDIGNGYDYPIYDAVRRSAMI